MVKVVVASGKKKLKLNGKKHNRRGPPLVLGLYHTRKGSIFLMKCIEKWKLSTVNSTHTQGTLLEVEHVAQRTSPGDVASLPLMRQHTVGGTREVTLSKVATVWDDDV